MIGDVHVYPAASTPPHVLSEDCWCEPRVEHVAADPQPQPAEDTDITEDAQMGDDPVPEPAEEPDEGDEG